MRDLGRGLVAIGKFAERWFDRLRFGLKRRTGRMSPVEILPYRGHGTRERLFLKGRVLETSGLAPPGAGDSWRRNLRNMARRFFSSEVPHARVHASLCNHRGMPRIEATADEEGFFDLRFELAEPLANDTEWHPVEIELLWPPAKGRDATRAEPLAKPRATGSVLVPAGADFGVVSDLDDTVIRSDVTNLLGMARTVLLGNAHTRLPFEGVAEFYGALQRGRGGGGHNPIFYVSNGPWNLYDLIEDFLRLQGVPAGPLFLRDWSPTALRERGRHKLGVIRTLLETYPELPFVLIGDSGEKDPEIYRQIVREHPGRIRAIFIRDVTTKERDAAVHAIAAEVRELGVEMLLSANTSEAAEHAAGNGLIEPGTPDARRGEEFGG